MSRFDAATLQQWLSHLETLHPSAIDMGLGRVSQVRDALSLRPAFPILTVGGTNGKGSVCAMLSSILRAAGYKVGTYTSPHILKYNERIMLNMVPVADEPLIDAFRAIEAARGDITLSYFEFGTLAAIHQFIAADVDVAVLEVGLGGRLDAVNAFDADIAAVVSIGIDHQNYLGNTREAIGYEKAGIFRAGKPAFCADPHAPYTLLEHAQAIGADLRLVGRDFGFQKQNEDQQWMAWSKGRAHHHALPFPALRGDYQLGNAALALAMLDELHATLPVSLGAIKQGLLEVEWPARFQMIPGRPAVVFDVGHNPHAAKVLCANLDQMGYFPFTRAVFGMMADKDIAGVVELLADRIDAWYVAAPALPRAAAAEILQAEIRKINPQAQIFAMNSIEQAWLAACESASEADRILVFGSFHTVAEVMAYREKHA